MLCGNETVLEAALATQEQQALVELVILVESVGVVEPSVKSQAACHSGGF